MSNLEETNQAPILNLETLKKRRDKLYEFSDAINTHENNLSKYYTSEERLEELKKTRKRYIEKQKSLEEKNKLLLEKINKQPIDLNKYNNYNDDIDDMLNKNVFVIPNVKIDTIVGYYDSDKINGIRLKFSDGGEKEYGSRITTGGGSKSYSLRSNEYVVKIDPKETDKRIDQIAKTQKNFKDAEESYAAKVGDLVVFDYKATVDGKDFKGNEGKNTQLELGKDLFIKGFDKQLEGVKNQQDKKVEVKLPENFPEKEVANKSAVFECKITAVRKPEETKIDDNFAKNLGAKDLNNLKELISKQINEEFKNSLEMISKKQILEQIEKQKLDQLPANLIEQEVNILAQGMKEEEKKKNMKYFEEQAKKRIKTGLILNAFGEKNKIKVSQEELNVEIQKQFRMMPGQEKMVKEYYEKNPGAIDSLRGSVYEEKIIAELKKIAKVNKKEISKEEAEKILKEENEKNLKEQEKLAKLSESADDKVKEKKEVKPKDKKEKKTAKPSKALKKVAKKTKSTKKVSKK